jgi:hypothetical protein
VERVGVLLAALQPDAPRPADRALSRTGAYDAPWGLQVEAAIRNQSDECGKRYDRVTVEPSLEKAATMWQQMNEVVINNVISVPLVDRTFSSGTARHLTGPAPRTFDWETWNIAEWKKG